MIKKILFAGFVLVGHLLLAQPSNDNCSGAISLGTLGNPASCGAATTGTKKGTTTTVPGTLNGATPENPYTSLTSCSGAGGNMAQPANDVWYSFVCPPNGAQVTLSISGASFTPNMALWQGTCAGLVGRGCTVGTAAGTATLTVAGMSAGATYYIQLSGNTGQTGNFNLSAYAWQDCAECNTASSLTVTPLPVNGMYQPGQTVQFCYQVTGWNIINVNWLHGVEVSFGSGWNAASLTAGTPPPPCSGSGQWLWMPTGEVGVSGVNYGPGFYFDLDMDGDPSNNYGDDCNTASITASTWIFCVSLTVGNTCNPGADLSVHFHTTSDGESGSWTNTACANDPTTNFSAVQGCCPPTVTSTSVLCNGGTTGAMTANAITGGAGAQNPYVFTWTGAASATNTVSSGTSNSFPNVPAGTYTVTVTDKNLCAASATITVVQPAPLTANLVPTNATCAGMGSITNTPGGGTAPYTYAWSGPGAFTSTTKSPSGLSPGTYTLVLTDNNNCTITKTVTVAQTGAITVAVNSPTVCANASVGLLASGATSYTWTPAPGLSATSGSSVTDNVPSTTSYTVVGTTGTCTNSAVALVTVITTPTVAVTNSVICSNTKVVLTASGASSYTWSTGGSISTVTVLPTSTTNYTVVGANGTCTASAVATVSVITNPTVTVSNANVCSGTSGVLTASGANTYTWSTSATGANL
ncbi:MAG: hypothetical protein JST67_10385, partial [Bacteroidetes bacterium]|nr:hypothetical protein [Bacteroidota bacterium]